MRKYRIYVVRLVLKSLDFLFGFKDIGGHTFFVRGLNRDSVVIDLGGHQGYFSSQMLHRYKCSVHVVEPVPSLYESIPKHALLTKYNFAVTSEVGEATFYESENIQAGSIVGRSVDFNGQSYKVQTKSILAFLDELDIQKVDLVKIDIEGAEIELINSLDFDIARRIKQMTVEFHDSTPNPNIQKDEVLRTIAYMLSLGFYGINMGDDNRDWFFINSQHVRLSVSSKIYLRVRKKAYSILRNCYGQ